MKKFLILLISITLLFAIIIYYTFTWGSELLSTIIADIIPAEIQKQIGESSIQSMDIKEFEKTKLSVYTQTKIKKQFYQLVEKDSNEVVLLFRKAVYPNAFALPGNYIIVLDSLIKMSKDTLRYADVMGVLAHEAGHLQYKHSLKLMIQSGLTAAIVGYFIGDFSAFAATLTHQLLSLSYSRKYENEADDYAILLLNKNKIPTLPLANLLERINQYSNEKNIPEFLSTHPVTKERVEKLKKNSNFSSFYN